MRAARARWASSHHGGARPTGRRQRPIVLAGALTVGLMLLTSSVASQLLSRAAYMSGATVHGLEGRDALAGVLDRQKAPLEERTDTAEDAGD